MNADKQKPNFMFSPVSSTSGREQADSMEGVLELARHYCPKGKCQQAIYLNVRPKNHSQTRLALGRWNARPRVIYRLYDKPAGGRAAHCRRRPANRQTSFRHPGLSRNAEISAVEARHWMVSLFFRIRCPFRLANEQRMLRSARVWTRGHAWKLEKTTLILTRLFNRWTPSKRKKPQARIGLRQSSG